MGKRLALQYGRFSWTIDTYPFVRTDKAKDKIAANTIRMLCLFYFAFFFRGMMESAVWAWVPLTAVSTLFIGLTEFKYFRNKRVGRKLSFKSW